VIHTFPFVRETPVELSAQLNYLREHEPVTRIRLPTGETVWLVTRYDDVRFVLGDPRFSMAAAAAGDSDPNPMVRLYPGLVSLDPPLHTRVRSLLTVALEAQPTDRVRRVVALTTEELISALLDAGPPGDLVDDLCEPLVTSVAATLLGVDPQAIENFRKHFAAVNAFTGVSNDDATAEADGVRDVVAEVVRSTREHRGDGVFSHIVAGFDVDSTLPERNLIGLGASVLSATAIAPVAQVAHAIVALLRHQDQWELLRSDPTLIDAAVSECFRFSAPREIDHVRVTTEDVEVGGVLLRKGSHVLTSVAAANRHESTFPDAGAFQVTRAENAHLGFGHGLHICPGASIGSVILSVVLSLLVERLPSLRLAVADSQLFVGGTYSHGLAIGAVPITW
jgi:cytochrome P450 monooxygenase OleP